jgi:hypothetical protein
VDSPGTGFSRVSGKDNENAFYGVDAHPYAFAEFITGFLSKHAPHARLGLGNGTASSRGGRKVKAMATAPRPMPNEPM